MYQDISNFYQCQDSDLYKVESKESLLGVGKGLFAKMFIQKGEIISQYRGPIIDTKYSEHEVYAHEDKMVYINTRYCVLGRNIAALANDIIKFEPEKFNTSEYDSYKIKKTLPLHNGFTRNAAIRGLEKDKIFLIATKDIKPDEEIYTQYGFDYWQFFLKRVNLEKTQL